VGFLATASLTLLVSLEVGEAGPTLILAPDGGQAAAQVAVRSTAATASLLLVAATTPLPDILASLGRLGVPQPIVETMALIYRWIFLLAEVASRGRRAQTARLGFATSRRWVQSTSLLAAALLPRMLAKATRVEMGLEARGYDGTLRTLAPVRPVDRRFVAATLALLLGLAATGMVPKPQIVDSWLWSPRLRAAATAARACVTTERSRSEFSGLRIMNVREGGW
ncbi:MAG: CbiQ family ECF transporter T component, partial [Alphaproteobacteria bacterium]